MACILQQVTRAYLKNAAVSLGCLSSSVVVENYVCCAMFGSRYLPNDDTCRSVRNQHQLIDELFYLAHFFPQETFWYELESK